MLDAVTDAWPAMRAAGLRALKDIDLDTFVIVLSGLDADPHPSVRTAVVSLLPALGPERATPRLAAMMDGRDPAVAAAAVEAMAGLPVKPKEFAATLQRLLVGGDVMVRAAAASALGELKPAGGDQALAAAYRAGAADELYQARAAALAALAKYGPAAAQATLNEALGDREWAVRLRAAALLREFDPAADLSARIRPAPGRAVEAYASPSLVSPQVSPHVFLDTDKGTVEIELAVLEAPLTAASFLALARSGYFSGMAIHRVVPNFVVQAGDRRGDGEGGPGYTLRDEINTLPVPARHRRHGARRRRHRRQPVLHHPLAAAPSRRQVHRLRPRGGRHGRRGSPAAVGCDPARPQLGRDRTDHAVGPAAAAPAYKKNGGEVTPVIGASKLSASSQPSSSPSSQSSSP